MSSRADIRALRDEQFPEKTRELKARFAGGTPLDDLVPEAFALVREASRRKLGLRHFDVQLIGGLALHSGKIAEMRTGEGKTLMATLPGVSQRAHRRWACTSSPSTNTWRSATRTGWARCSASSACNVGVIKNAQIPGREARRLRLRHHLRHQQRIRLRLPARQPRVSPGGPRTAQALLRHRRRGRLDPDRRGAHAADHLGARRGEHRALHQDQHADPAADQAEAGGRARRLRRRREDQAGHAHRGRAREGRGADGGDRACCARARASTTPPTSA